MNRQEFEHIVRAAAGITGQKEFIIIGSQSILGKFPDAPRVLRNSMELDLYPKDHPELADLISGCLGEYSTFHDTFKYYADGVSPATAILPTGWQHRLERFTSENTGGAVAYCLDPVDLAYAKLAAGRPKDIGYVVDLIRHRLIKPSALAGLIGQTEDSALREVLNERWQVVQAKKTPQDSPTIVSGIETPRGQSLGHPSSHNGAK